MKEDNIPVITDREELYDRCENMEQLFDKYYLPLLDKHYSKTYKLQQENQELKKHLEVPETCNLKTLKDYKGYYQDISKEQILEDTYIDYCAYVNLAHRYSELKKQLEETIKSYTEEYTLRHEIDLKLDIAKTQQKEFIKYLGDEIDYAEKYKRDCVVNELKEILSKYKEIVGDK